MLFEFCPKSRQYVKFQKKIHLDLEYPLHSREGKLTHTGKIVHVYHTNTQTSRQDQRQRAM